MAACDAQEGAREEVAKRFKVSLGMVKKLLAQRARTGDLRARYRDCGRKAKLPPERGGEMKQRVVKEPDLTLAEIKQRLGLGSTVAAIHWVLAKMGLTDEKTLDTAEQNRPDVAPARRRWRRRQGGLDPARRVFTDESAAKTNMTRRRGRAPKAGRLICPAPQGHWQTNTRISSVRRDGSSAGRTVERATNPEVLRASGCEILVPALRLGDMGVMDNLGAHKNEPTLERIRRAGAEVRFLPAYSPDLNPIEMIWSDVNALLRKAHACNHSNLLTAIAAALCVVPSQDALGWFAACGYNFI